MVVLSHVQVTDGDEMVTKVTMTMVTIHINIFKFKSLLHNNNIGSGLISFVAVQRSSHSSAEIAKHYTITRIHEG